MRAPGVPVREGDKTDTIQILRSHGVQLAQGVIGRHRANGCRGAVGRQLYPLPRNLDPRETKIEPLFLNAADDLFGRRHLKADEKMRVSRSRNVAM